jgi:uncharacterized membrane protein YeaQ/YmgE (transglycosylase-associated protein family)
MLVALISWIAVGVIAGAVGGKVVNLRGDDPRLGLLVGAIAASVGGFAFRFFSSTITTGPGLWSLVIAAATATAALAIWYVSRSVSRA